MELLKVDIEKAGYNDSFSSLSEVQFVVNAGETVGLIGPNGAGKSTVTKAILGVLPHVDGIINVNSLDSKIGYVPEQPLYYEGLTLWEHFELAAAAYDIAEGELNKGANLLMKDFDMENVIHGFPGTFSKGMKQKLMIMLSLFIEPSLFVVDEPFIGLDPSATKQLIMTLNKEKEKGSGILLSTHVLDTAEKICDRFILISNGTIVSSGTLLDIQCQTGIENGSLLDCFYEIVEAQKYARN